MDYHSHLGMYLPTFYHALMVLAKVQPHVKLAVLH